MKNTFPQIDIRDYSYELPKEQIAFFPLPEREDSKMLVFQNSTISDRHFYEFPKLFQQPHFLVLNETKVIHARLIFSKPTGAKIEIFCLQPAAEYPDISTALAQKTSVNWNCIIGNKKKWKANDHSIHLQVNDEIRISAKILSEEQQETTIQFSWEPQAMSFAEILHLAGKVPLPPYIKRTVTAADEDRYQTVFAVEEGSVAAPTASLHISESILQQLKTSGHILAKTCLHVGAGTFMPVKDHDVSAHVMHEEWMKVEKEFLNQWLMYLESHDQAQTVAVGTTACRTLESIYWIGVKLICGLEIEWSGTALKQWEAYELPQTYGLKESLQAWMTWMNNQKISVVQTKTQLIIVPSYRFKSVDVLVTNFHQPESTLLLLVAAFCKEDYQKIYQHALEQNYRFLSYGDGSVLFKN